MSHPSDELYCLHEIAGLFAAGYTRLLAQRGNCPIAESSNSGRRLSQVSLIPLDSSGERSDLSASTQQGNLF